MAQKQTCPRRMYDMGPWEREEGKDTWSLGHGPAAQDALGTSCSFCGSLHPERFMELVRDGWIVGPTDKSYKAYLERPLTDEELAAHKARWLEGFTDAEIQATADDRGETFEQAKAALDDVYDRQIARIGGAKTEAKFYYQHLTEPQQREFVDLYNSRRMKVGYPGHFYQLPYFMELVPPENDPPRGA